MIYWRAMSTRRTFLSTLGSAALLRAGEQNRAFRASPDSKDLRKSQLFLDDTWIEESYRLERVWESAEVYPEPVLRPEMPWEGHQVVMFGSVFRDAAGWRMYYMTYNRPAPSLLCLAYSSDGLHWERPKLGLFEYQGSKANNIVFAPEPGKAHDGPTVCHDPADPKAPYKMIYYMHGEGVRAGEHVAFSRDGVEWKHHPEPVLTTGDRTNVLPSRDHRGKFVAYMRHRDMMRLHRARSIWRTESDDFLHWSEPEAVLRADLLDDANTELYGMAVFPYSDLYLGLLERWYDNPDVIELQLAWSHDGKDWQRPQKRSAFLGPAFPWNKGLELRGEHGAGAGGQSALVSTSAGAAARMAGEAPQSYGAIGLASARRRPFSRPSAATSRKACCSHRPMTWPGGGLLLNSTNTALSGGRIPRAAAAPSPWKCAMRTTSPWPASAAPDKAVVNSNSTLTSARELKFGGGRTLSTQAGKRIRLAIGLRDARLYSFRATV